MATATQEVHRRTLGVFLESQATTARKLIEVIRAHMDDGELDSFQAECLRGTISKLEGTASTIDRTVIALRTKPA